MSANEIQIGGDHYKTQAIQPWDFIALNNLGYLEGCVVKYVSRHSKKGGIEDLNKAKHYLEKLIELNSEPPQEPRMSVGLTDPTGVFGLASKATPLSTRVSEPAKKAPARRGRPPGVKNKRSVK
jgi:hypothetical protein